MKKWIWVGFAGVVLLWALGAWALLSAVQAKLETAASHELARPEYTGGFDQVKVTFSGQEATLTGKVGSQQEHDQLTTLITEGLRTPDSGFNPVTAVVNHVGVAYELSRLQPKPWLLMARFGGEGIIAGVVPADLRDRATQVLSTKLTGLKLTSKLNANLGSDAKPRPVLNATAALDAKAMPPLANDEVAVSTLNGQWTSLKADSQDIDVSVALASASVDSSDVIDALAPLRAWQAAEAEKVRQTKLPPAYAGVVALPDSLHVFGLAGDDESQRRLLVALGASYPKRKVLTSAVKISNDVRAAADWASLVTTLPNKEGEAFIAGLTAADKPLARAVTWDGKGDLAAMQKALGSVLPPSFNFATLWEPYGAWLKAKQAPAPAVPAIKLAPAPATPAAPASAAPAVKLLPPPSGNAPAGPVTIPKPTLVPAPAPIPAPSPAK